MKYLLNGCVYVCRFRVWCGWVWASLVIHGQKLAKMDLVGGCAYECMSSGSVWVIGKFRHIRARLVKGR